MNELQPAAPRFSHSDFCRSPGFLAWFWPLKAAEWSSRLALAAWIACKRLFCIDEWNHRVHLLDPHTQNRCILVPGDSKRNWHWLVLDPEPQRTNDKESRGSSIILVFPVRLTSFGWMQSVCQLLVCYCKNISGFLIANICFQAYKSKN